MYKNEDCRLSKPGVSAHFLTPVLGHKTPYPRGSLPASLAKIELQVQGEMLSPKSTWTKSDGEHWMLTSSHPCVHTFTIRGVGVDANMWKKNDLRQMFPNYK